MREKTAGMVLEETEVEPRSRICLRRRGEARPVVRVAVSLSLFEDHR